MNILIVYAHPESNSFDNAMKEKALEVLTGDGHAVQLSDLYAMNFKAVADADDFIDPVDTAAFNLFIEQMHASQYHTFAPDILGEQQKVLWSDILIFQFPLWWYSLPAILKGWIDRVLAYGFAYGRDYNMAGRRAMLALTTGGLARPYTLEKRAAMNEILDHVQRSILHFCGFDVLPPFAVYGAASATAEQREQFLLQYTQLLHTIGEIPPIDYDHRSP